MKPLRVLFIITGLGSGGAEFMLLRLLQHLDRRRFEPHVISLTGGGDVGTRIAGLGVRVEHLGMNPGRLPVGGWWRLHRRIVALRPDVVHTWMYHADLLGGTAARLAGVRAVVWGIHHSNLSPHLNKRSTLLVARACALVSRFVPARIACCSEAARDVHRAFGYQADKLVFVPNGFELNLFRPDPEARTQVRRELGIPDDALIVGMIGRYNPQKNHAGFMRAAGQVHRWLPDVRFVLAGTGVDRSNEALMRLVEDEGVASVMHLLGPRTDVPRIMATLDVLASSSDGEAFPNVIGEAMACEVPCVVTDVGDCAAIVGNSGCVVAPGDMAGLAQSIRDLLVDAPRRGQLGRQARARVDSCYSIDKVVAQYEGLYESVMHRESHKCAA